MAMAKRWVIDGNKNEYNYTPWLSVLAYKLSGDARYIQSAIADTNAYVEAQIALACGTSTTAPDIATDSYLYAGDHVQDIAMTLDYGFSLLTDAQKARWLALMDQVTSNIWGDPAKAKWGGTQFGCTEKTIGWSGWALDPPYGPNPGNNYYYRSFAKTAMFMALLTRDAKWTTILQTKAFPLIVTYYAAKVPEGGSREGTGYGVSQMTLFDDYRMWKASTGEDLSAYSAHAKNSSLFWMHATVPALDRFVPVGDQSRSSDPVWYDYHRTLVLEAARLSPGTPEAKNAAWLLKNVSVTQMGSGFNLPFDLLGPKEDAVAPTALTYYAKGAGVYFARSAWAKDASHMSFLAGQFEESHAGQNQGGFTFYKNGWLAVTSNIWSHSGIHQEVASNNVMRFEKTGGSIVPQNQYADSASPTIANSTDDSGLHLNADLSAAFSSNRSSVTSWKRDLTYKGDVLTVHDTCVVGTGVTPVWQVHVPALPVLQADGSIVAGSLKITPKSAVLSPVIEQMSALDSDYLSGHYRVSLKMATGCEFTIELKAQ